MLTVIILAAGKGTRMNDMNLPKVLRKVGDKTMLEHVFETAKKLTDNIVIVVSEENKKSIEELDLAADYCVQTILNGTASAVLSAKDKFIGDILVLLGDVPLITYETLFKVIQNDKSVILGFENEDNTNKFGRLVLNEEKVIKIVEYAEATEEEKNIKNVNSGILFLKSEYKHYLKEIDNKNSKSEFYLTDIVKILNSQGIEVAYIEASKQECLGANTPQDLILLNQIFLEKILRYN